MEHDKIDDTIERLRRAEDRLKGTAQGRVFNVGTLVLFRGRLGTIVDLNQGSEDPAGSTVDIRMEDGEVVEKVKVSSSQLKFFRA